jgi:ectoine hydroxylase-related dioxygenase (phytanoyl-CoA dioxygenase family)
MICNDSNKEEIERKGFTIIEDLYCEDEVLSMLDQLLQVNSSHPTFRKTRDLFAIRQFLKEVPEVIQMVFTGPLLAAIDHLFGRGYFAVKSIYFDKPEVSNWFVAYHQDLTISVNRKVEMEGFGPWTVKQNQFAVQPPLDYLESNFTVRIHLDDTDEQNGALRVVPSSHKQGVCRPENIDWTKEPRRPAK